MNQKEKGKSHPFAGTLHPDEEVLWMVSIEQPSMSPGSQLAVGITLWGIVALLYVVITPIFKLDSQLITCFFFLGPLAALIGLAFLISGLVHLFTAGVRRVFRMRESTPTNSYAVTNERLLYRGITGYQVISMPLERLYWMETHQKRISSTLVFKVPSPMIFGPWRDLENADEVKDIIEQAYKKRLEEVGQ